VPPLLPYGRQTIEDDDIQAVIDVLRGDYLTTGPAIARFEAALAEKVGSSFAVAVASGTAALHAAYAAAAVGPGDRVIVPAMTFVATANAACFLGAEPVFADVDPDTGLIRPDDVERRIDGRTRAIVPVHLTGAPADMTAIAAVSERHGVAVIEDAAHALGASDEAGAVGSCARSSLAAFSFHPVKPVTTGEGGAITGNDRALEAKLRAFRDHGIVRDPTRMKHASPGPWYYEQQSLGHNLRMTDIQAALGTSQLQKLDRFLERRRSLAARYDRLLEGVPGVRRVGVRSGRTAHHLYAVLIDFRGMGQSRRAVMESLRSRGIGSQVHYIPVPMQPYYRERGSRIEELPGARAYYERTLSLPLFPAMADTDVDRVVAALAAALAAPKEGSR
jgi:UDP-4-amino-4,6-dideoxy-N-acetyl-beta-L-altrosamine transaminase